MVKSLWKMLVLSCPPFRSCRPIESDWWRHTTSSTTITHKTWIEQKINFIIITLLFSIEWTDHKISCNRSETFDKLVSVFSIASKVCRVISTKKCSRESERCLHDEWEIEIYIFESLLMTFCTKDEGVLTVIRLFS